MSWAEKKNNIPSANSALGLITIAFAIWTTFTNSEWRRLLLALKRSLNKKIKSPKILKLIRERYIKAEK